MELAGSRSISVPLTRRVADRIDGPALAAWTLAFALVAYLALSNGGYDTVVRSEAGLAVWWIVLLGAVSGVLRLRLGVAGWLAIGLLGAFAAWTAMAIGWSESAERSALELGRVAAYLGVLVLAIALQGRTAARHTINGIASAIALVAGLAVLSRLHPQWFPVNDHAEFLGDSARKLSYPLNYWNALAAFAAIGVPLLAAVAMGARTLTGRAAAAAALPACALCVYLTISRGGVIALGVGIAAFVVCCPRRLHALATLLLAAAGSAILISAASQRDALQDGAPTATAIAQGTELLWLAAIVCAGVALMQVAIALSARHEQPPGLLAPGRPLARFGGLAALVALAVVAVGAGLPGYASDRWQEFKQPSGVVTAGSQDSVISRLQAANGNGRYEYWQSAIDALETAPLKGIGPGTFEFWWSRNGTTDGFVRDAHSLYFETLAETGIVGLVLLGGLLLWLLAAGVARLLRAAPELRLWIAAAIGGLAAFITAAAFEWVWEMAAIAVVAMALGAVMVCGRDGAEEPVRGATLPPRIGMSLLALVAIGVIVVPFAATRATDDSRAAAADGRLAASLSDSGTAQRLQPYAATPRLQRALVLEQGGDLARASSAARAATAEEPTNWRPWLVLARIEARRGDDRSALAALRTARKLNPRSPLLRAR